MAAIIPDLKIDIQDLHSARRKLQSLSKDGRIEFTGDEREALLTLIRESRSKVYPSPVKMDTYQHYIDRIGCTPEDSPQFDILSNKIAAFEQKFCK